MTGHARWLRFNVVGVAGFAVQMLTLAAVDRLFAAPVGVAVTLAVLAAVSHNFLWHERVTWPGQPRQGRWRRWLSFNVTTGVISVVTNVIVTTSVATITGAPLLVSNSIAVAAASLLNFWVSDRVVFNGPRSPRLTPCPFHATRTVEASQAACIPASRLRALLHPGMET
jgi:putative flippase GtrA